MKVKIFSFIFSLFIALFAFCQSANAMVSSDSDIHNKMNKLNVIINTDFISFINKTELIGNRLTHFEMATAQYKNHARMSRDNLQGMLEQTGKIKSSLDMTEADKNMQVSMIYQNATNMLFNMDIATTNYLASLKYVMPSITYSRFIKKYQDFYNGLNLTDSDVELK